MPRPPADGCYAVRRPSGAAFILSYSGGQLVDVIQVSRQARPPKRTTTRYLGPSLTAVRAEIRQREEEELIRAFVEGTSAARAAT